MKNKKIFVILDVIGGVFVLVSFILNELKLLPIILIELLAIIGFSLCLPDSINFIRQQTNKDEKVAIFWSFKFLAILICLIGLIIAFLVELFRF